MKKQVLTMVTLGALALGAVAPTFSASALINPSSNLNDQTVVDRKPGQSMVLSMREVAGIFVGRYAEGAVHSISLHPSDGNFEYVVVGYTPKKTYTIHVDCITGKITKTEESGRMKDIPSKIFNPLTIIEPKAAEKAAVSLIGEGAVSRGWEVATDKSVTAYVVDVYTADSKIKVTVNAENGQIMGQSKPEKLDQTNK